MPVSFYYDNESDPGPYPIPGDVPIEGGPASDGDRHVIAIDEGACVLYEMFDSHPQNGGQSWQAGSGAVFNLNSNALRPDFWTSADAAGLPIFAGLARYSEVVEQGVIDHALRFTVSQTRRAFIHPATHFASSNTGASVPPMGLRLRMKAGYNCSGFSAEVRVICAALKKYGMIVADNGSDWYVSGAPDSRWNDDALGDLKQVPGDAFEVVYTGAMISDVPIPDEPAPPKPPSAAAPQPPAGGSAPAPEPAAPAQEEAPSATGSGEVGGTPFAAAAPAATATAIPAASVTPTPTPRPSATADPPKDAGDDGGGSALPITLPMLGLAGLGAGGGAFLWARRRRGRSAG